MQCAHQTLHSWRAAFDTKAMHTGEQMCQASGGKLHSSLLTFTHTWFGSNVKCMTIDAETSSWCSHTLFLLVISSGIILFLKYEDFHASCFLFRTIWPLEQSLPVCQSQMMNECALMLNAQVWKTQAGTPQCCVSRLWVMSCPSYSKSSLPVSPYSFYKFSHLSWYLVDITHTHTFLCICMSCYWVCVSHVSRHIWCWVPARPEEDSTSL